MLELAIAGHAAFRVCTLEVETGGVNYSVDTLQRLKDEQPERELFFLMGADSLADLPRWKEPARLCQIATPVVVGRTNHAGQGTGGDGLDWGGLAELLTPERLEEIRRSQVAMPRVELSSSEIRQRVARGQSIRYRTPRAVEKYIETNGLYRA